MRFQLSRLAIARPALRAPVVPAARSIHSTTLLRTTAGYGDPQDEKADNHTPTPTAGKPSSSADPQPEGKGKGTKSTSGTTDPEVKPKKSSSSSKKNSDSKSVEEKTGNAGGDGGARTKKTPSEQEIKETKKVGEEPKNEKVGGAGPIGG